MLAYGDVYHVGLVVPNLEAGIEEVADRFGVTFPSTQAITFHIRSTARGDQRVPLRFAYSHEGPPFLEVIEAYPDSPWELAEGSSLHHLGVFVDDLDGEIARLSRRFGEVEARFIGALEERNREAAERIRALMFVFEDLAKLDPGGIQTLLRAVEKDQLGLALKGASESLRELFFSNMSERASKIMREDMESMGPVRLKDVDQAQMAMVQVAKDLAAKGEIMLVGQGGDDELIY